MQVVPQAHHQCLVELLLIDEFARNDGRVLLQVDDDEVLLEQLPFRHQLACAIVNQAAAVEHELVVSADEIAVDHRAAGFRRQAAEHAAAGLVLPQVPR